MAWRPRRPRIALVRRLNDMALSADTTSSGRRDPGFPAARIGLFCQIADRLAISPALEAEDWLRARLARTAPATPQPAPPPWEHTEPT